MAPGKSAAVRTENVEISETSLSMQKLREEVNAQPEIRIQMVEEIKHKIKHNGYPLETNLYKALENLVDKNFTWHVID
ncbi:hypothetical protein CHISP_1887 [Chitinispirillum alkaliphilum]|nr:hypothetical protein CHISP_1887 [Chitinispirillum alkaliphilum]